MNFGYCGYWHCRGECGDPNGHTHTEQELTHLWERLQVAEHRIAKLEDEFDRRVSEAIERYKRVGTRGKMVMRP